MSLNRRQQLDYNQKYQVQSARVNFAHYVQVKQEIDEGNKVGLNIFPPDNNVSIVSYIKEGESYNKQKRCKIIYDVYYVSYFHVFFWI
jgi:hypothetical protein